MMEDSKDPFEILNNASQGINRGIITDWFCSLLAASLQKEGPIVTLEIAELIKQKIINDYVAINKMLEEE